jgi:hypothetical protein
VGVGSFENGATKLDFQLGVVIDEPMGYKIRRVAIAEVVFFGEEVVTGVTGGGITAYFTTFGTGFAYFTH